MTTGTVQSPQAPPEEPRLWIVHRDATVRLALARLAGAGAESVVGAPGDEAFETAAPPDVVLLGVGEAPDAELEFAHAAASRLAGCGWILLTETGALDAARQLFDLLDAAILPYPPTASLLRTAIREARARVGRARLSQRRSRDRVLERFGRWFAGLDLPSRLRASDPRLASVPLLVCGEDGTGRELVARTLHELGRVGGTRPGDAFIHVPCGDGDAGGALLVRIVQAAPHDVGPGHWTLWLEDAHRLAPAVQRLVRGWIEFGLPEVGTVQGRTVRWVVGAGDPLRGGPGDVLEPGLLQVLSGLSVRLPALRERPATIAPFAEETARAWARARGERPRTFADEARETLRAYPWPGNLRELEGVVERSLAGTAADPVRSEHLAFEPVPGFRRPAPAVSAPERPAAPAAPAAAGPEDEGGAEPDVRPAAAANVLGVRGVSSEVGPAVESDEPAAERAETAHTAQTAEEPADRDAAAPPVLPGPDELAASVDEIPTDEAALRRLVGAIAHEVRNPLTSIRTFAELLPEHAGDEEFLERFSEYVGAGVRRIEAVISRLQELSVVPQPDRQPVDVAAMLEELLDARRDRIRQHSLLVLRELDRDRPEVLADEAQLRDALASLLDRALELVPDRGDLYLASRHHERGLREAPSVRILLRFATSRDRAPRPEGGEAEASIDLLAIENRIRAQGGTLTVDTGDAGGAAETVVVLDLPAP